jgi:glutamyl-tRNA synthetase
VVKEVRTRFAPSPTGDLHVGNIRTALFDWAYARHTGGKLIFRIEDTDRERVTDEYINRAVETMKWLGLNWDEGPEIGGPCGPYLQSQRLDIYKHWAQKFLDDGFAYKCYCSTEELEARREKQRELNQAPGYDGKCRNLSADEEAKYIAEGRAPVIRMQMPAGETRFTDDVLMKITHVLRGEDLLSSTPRQIRVYQAMGVAPEDYPHFAHLPFVMGQDNAKLSKRNGEVSIAWYREEGFLPEAICNYLSLLGWSPGDDRENITMEELVSLFNVERVNSSPARFDMKKLEAINGDKIRALTIDEFLKRALPFLTSAKIITGTDEEIALVRKALPIVQERIVKLKEVVPMLGFFFVETVKVEEESVAKMAEEQALHVLSASLSALEPLSQWDHESIESALRAALIEKMGLKPRNAFGPVRIAVTGSHISPPLFESMELLGKERSIARIKALVR